MRLRAVNDADRARLRPNRVLLAVLGAFAVIAVVAGVLTATRSIHQYDRKTPEGVVQGYLSAVVNGDHETAAAFLAPESPCAVEDLDRAYTPEGFRAVLRSSKVDAGSAQVRVDVVTSTEGPLNTLEHSEQHTFRLVRAGEAWLITGEPWPTYACGKEA